ncbi:hypothetical protein TNIN_51871 [Trichonephila inaurata madagascariensis]|uniref:Uncharacterized protein n=1 Tax=Trichonephila inaurata madagascariensis TaxID=2747483 RepID=A0A8X6XM04_9ARAC|nr:hypothetical protein TNIN_51871 [Trichonephila inaurata madagascariensis]
MSVVRLKTLFWEIERRKTSLRSSHTARNRSDFNIRHLGNYFNGRSLTGLHLSVSRKGMECVSECPAHPRPVRSLSVQVKASKCELKCWKATI